MKNVFVVGHGFVWNPKREFRVGANSAVTFYCKDEKMFDSAWEEIVMEKVKSGKAPVDGDIARAKQEWEITIKGASVEYLQGQRLLPRRWRFRRLVFQRWPPSRSCFPPHPRRALDFVVKPLVVQPLIPIQREPNVVDRSRN